MDDDLVEQLAEALRMAKPQGEQEVAAFCVGFLFRRTRTEQLLDELMAERYR